MTKRIGETVTLEVNTKHQLKNFLWSFVKPSHYDMTTIAIITNGEIIQVNGTRFNNRLYTDVMNGSITITNLTVGDTGTFLLQIFTETGIVAKKFQVTVICKYFSEIINIPIVLTAVALLHTNNNCFS